MINNLDYIIVPQLRKLFPNHFYNEKKDSHYSLISYLAYLWHPWYNDTSNNNGMKIMC